MLPIDFAVLKGNLEITCTLLEQNASSGKTSTRIVAAARFDIFGLVSAFCGHGK